MDGMHDLGGRQGFGPVNPSNRAAFHEHWEVKINAITGRLVKQHLYNMDEYRYAIERMEPRHYIAASYYERVFTSVATLCVEKGVITREELNATAGEAVPLAREGKPGREVIVPPPDIAIGDTVLVNPDFVAGHIRMPAYIRGKCGVVVGVSPAYPFPDAAAHGLVSGRQRTFDVRFKSSDLWPDSAEQAEVHVGVFHGYLSKVK